MSITSWARPFTTSAMALPAVKASPAICCPAAVQRKTNRLPAANAAALAGSDGTATISAGAGVGVVLGVGGGVGSGVVAMLYPSGGVLRALNFRSRIVTCHCLNVLLILELLPITSLRNCSIANSGECGNSRNP